MSQRSPVIHPVILSGGVGSRLWPLSRAGYPKQLLPIAGPRPMIAETAARVAGPGFAAATVVCNHEHRFAVAEVLAAAGLPPRRILLEPVARNTAPAVAVGALAVAEADPEAVMLVLPSDHVIGDPAAFHAAIAAGLPAANAGRLVTFGITPTRPETGYGYIRAGAALDGLPGVAVVDRFVEKPDAATAGAYLAEGGYTWNAGIFLFRAASLLEELERLAPAVLAAAREAYGAAARDLDFCRLSEAAFAPAPAVSLDVAVMERTGRAAVVAVDMGWSDVGAWDALWTLGTPDADGNVTQGDVIAEACRGSYLRSEDGRLIAAVGVEDLVVVATDDAVLVAPRARVQEVKRIVERLERAGRPEAALHTTVNRPWGTYRGVDAGTRYQVKQIEVKPGAALSLQYHHHRAEHWIVVEGAARVTCGERTFLLHENQSTFIPAGTVHRLENPGVIPLVLIEVQSGSYLGEDDIVRTEDVYGRS